MNKKSNDGLLYGVPCKKQPKFTIADLEIFISNKDGRKKNKVLKKGDCKEND